MGRRTLWRLIAVVATFLFLLFGALRVETWARAGGGRSFGGGSSRSYSSPRGNRPSQQNEYRSSQTQKQPATPSAPVSQPSGGGGFLRGLAGGIAGGFLGSMLFSSLGFGGGFGGMGGFGGGIGFLEILMFGAIVFFVVSYLRRRRQEALAGANGGHYTTGADVYRGGGGSSYGRDTDTGVEELPGQVDLDRGLAKVSIVVPSFEAERFPEEAMDIFFRIQGAWANRDLESVRNLLAAEVRQELQKDIDALKSQGKINRLENIAVRRSEIQEAWVEAGSAFITVYFLANLLDYTVEEQSGRLVGGSKESPVKFEEYWTFVRPSGGSSWQLTAIQQAE